MADSPKGGPLGLMSSVPARARWPLRLFLGASLALGLGLPLLGAGARPVLFVAFAATGALLAWTLWDETRGRAARLRVLRARWLEAGATERDSLPNSARPTGLLPQDLHLMEEGQPLIVRLALLGDVPTVAVLTPLPESTTAFAIASRHHPAPTFDGLEPGARSPSLDPLPGVGTLLEGRFEVRGNDPTRLTRLIDGELVGALAECDAVHRDTFRGLTFDGRFLAIHWLSDELAMNPWRALSQSAPLWRPFVPRLPPLPTRTLN